MKTNSKFIRVATFFVTTFAVFSVLNQIPQTEATWRNSQLFPNLKELYSTSHRRNLTMNSDSCSGMSSSKSEIAFIFCRHDEQAVEIVYDHSQSLYKSGFDPNERTYIITDGLISNFSSPMSQAMCHYLPLSKPTSNTIVVDWGKLSGSTATNLNLSNLTSFSQIYLCALANSLPAGNRIAEMIQFLNVDPLNVHLIGHSLGAYVSRIAADDYKSLTNKTVSRATFLDPATPACNFSVVKQDGPISSQWTDSHYTNMGGLGTSSTHCGGIDIFYNGGNHQPGCPVVNPPTLASEYCSHEYSHKAFISSFTEPLYGGSCEIPGSSNNVSVSCLDSTEPENFVAEFQVGLDMTHEPSSSNNKYAVYTNNTFTIPPPPYITPVLFNGCAKMHALNFPLLVGALLSFSLQIVVLAW